jgi:hypothetical protein
VPPQSTLRHCRGGVRVCSGRKPKAVPDLCLAEVFKLPDWFGENETIMLKYLYIACALIPLGAAAAPAPKALHSLDLFGIPVGQKFDWAECPAEGRPSSGSAFCFRTDADAPGPLRAGYIAYTPVFSEPLPSGFMDKYVHVTMNVDARTVDEIRVDYFMPWEENVLRAIGGKFGPPDKHSSEFVRNEFGARKESYTFKWFFRGGSELDVFGDQLLDVGTVIAMSSHAVLSYRNKTPAKRRERPL